MLVALQGMHGVGLVASDLWRFPTARLHEDPACNSRCDAAGTGVMTFVSRQCLGGVRGRCHSVHVARVQFGVPVIRFDDSQSDPRLGAWRSHCLRAVREQYADANYLPVCILLIILLVLPRARSTATS